MLIIISIYLILITKNNLNFLQQNFYNENNRYIRWGFNNVSKILKLDIIIFIINLLNIFIKNDVILLINLLYLLLYIYERTISKQENTKIPFRITNRIKRMIFTILTIYLVLIIIFNCNVYLLYFIFSLLVTLNYFVIWFANIINIPIEKIIYFYYRFKSVKKIRRFTKLQIVGITGSYGKTSTKNILNDILSIKYNSITTPKNYNTLYGLMITIDKYLDKFNDVFIAEMGAFKRGSIKKLCDLVKPKYGIITNIGVSHLESFGSMENIQKGKFELIETLPKDGIAILNMDDLYQLNYNLKNKIKIIWISIGNSNANLYVKNIVMDNNGMKFDVCFKKEGITQEFKTKLLGHNNIYNILYGIAFSRYIMNMDLDSIVLGVKKIKSIPHRLEIKNRGNYTIIDDAYNSNPIGSKMALDVLNLMDGTKIIVTPGMIELGCEQYNLNRKFGEYISEVVDYAILVGEKQTKPILDGLLNRNFSKNKIIIVNDIKKVFNIINNMKILNHAYILLENDLPDIYNER